MSVEHLKRATRAKNDEFYTRYEDIEKEVVNYKEQLKGLWIYCPCDDYRWSNFWKYFYDNFNELGLKKLTATNYDIGDGAFRADYDGENMEVVPLDGDGDFRSQECTKIKDECDIIITNPPFSIWREFFNWMKKDDEKMKQFLLVGAVTCCGYKDVFPYIRNREVKFRPQIYGLKEYINSDKKFISVWYTTMEIPYIEPLKLTKSYNPEDYPKYDNYDAIEVSKTINIPYDYEGVMGVPITFLSKWNPEQFEVVTIAAGHSWSQYKEDLIKLNFNPNLKYNGGLGIPALNGKELFQRLMIKRR